MSDRVGRRGLLGAILGRPEAPAPEMAEPREETAAAPPGFSLTAFYAERAAEPSPPLPHVALREGLPVVATTRVGLCPDAEELDLEDLIRRDEARS